MVTGVIRLFPPPRGHFGHNKTVRLFAAASATQRAPNLLSLTLLTQASALSLQLQHSSKQGNSKLHLCQAGILPGTFHTALSGSSTQSKMSSKMALNTYAPLQQGAKLGK